MSSSAVQHQSSKDALIGQQVGNLRIVARIGQGGFGAVYRAEHTMLGTPYAIKVLRVEMQSDNDIVERFRREAHTIAKLEHPHVVRVNDFGAMPGGGQFLAMELLSGQSLKEALRAQRRFTTQQIHRWLTDILDTLHYIHSLGIVHRDIKPANIFLHRSKPHHPEVVKMLDFGIAFLSNGQSLTQSGETIGSPVYMSPEQARGQSKYVDGRADLYSVGVMLYQMLVGRPPFRGENFTSTLLKQLQEPPPPLAFVAPDIPWSSALEDFLQKTLAKSPEQRWPDAAEMAGQLEVVLKEQEALLPGHEYPPPPPGATVEMPLFAAEIPSAVNNENTLHTPSSHVSSLHTLDPMPEQQHSTLALDSGSGSIGLHTLGQASPLPETRILKSSETREDLPAATLWEGSGQSLLKQTPAFPSPPMGQAIPEPSKPKDILEAPAHVVGRSPKGISLWVWAIGGLCFGLVATLLWLSFRGPEGSPPPERRLPAIAAPSTSSLAERRQAVQPTKARIITPRALPSLPRNVVRWVPSRRSSPRRSVVRKKPVVRKRRKRLRRRKRRRFRRRIRRRRYRRKRPPARRNDPFGGIEDPI